MYSCGLPHVDEQKVGRPARTYLQELSSDRERSLEELLGTMYNRDGWRERVREITANMMMTMIN